MTERNAENCINVGLGKIAIAHAPDVLTSIGVGSCVILCLYHETTHTGGLAHIMLPYNDGNRAAPEMPAKFVGLAIENLLNEFHKKGIKNPHELIAKIIGGAQLFIFKQVQNIGERNVDTVILELKNRGIRVIASDIGGTSGRSLWFYPDTGKVVIRSKMSEIKEI